MERTHAIALEILETGLRAVNIVPGGISSGIGITDNLSTPHDADWNPMSRLTGRLDGGALM